ncbi:hypothetical protein LEP1GSC036_2933 [Leptospira weilii str. 2006001853]|uniref:Uncharacterized protein n=4 Tax=Leptospira weilii TaxID=28184 RepID=A0A828Z4F6_9LEPT|nr:hypothetical protein LEP1GSC036_2933 [Leptospira weilii str. 2006001853]EMJ67449.1 hypothetical protein LEP1GSC051_1737 [Leptospira sp. P2653]EMM71303.1 hypothetical protein LEP1GSC038_3103 [Leptospira weilii str. 2006001855]EMN43036.1 hypothetical protein LEP1GSC086_0100 [Leptospira weilii str. LNT 1234]EMN88481.1 hypothetical protein LEP1GSC108_2031 [Leptospira weilii str. UI 13098]EMY13084.1 hypothetical protein LEP1GSC043_2441 [Leptospira weilii str. Ecochallenge]
MVSENNEKETKNNPIHVKGILKDLNFISTSLRTILQQSEKKSNLLDNLIQYS